MRLEHSGFAKTGPAGLTIRDMLASGWNSKILRERLPELLDRQARADDGRQTDAQKEQTA